MATNAWNRPSEEMMRQFRELDRRLKDDFWIRRFNVIPENTRIGVDVGSNGETVASSVACEVIIHGGNEEIFGRYVDWQHIEEEHRPWVTHIRWLGPAPLKSDLPEWARRWGRDADEEPPLASDEPKLHPGEMPRQKVEGEFPKAEELTLAPAVERLSLDERIEKLEIYRDSLTSDLVLRTPSIAIAVASLLIERHAVQMRERDILIHTPDDFSRLEAPFDGYIGALDLLAEALPGGDWRLSMSGVVRGEISLELVNPQWHERCGGLVVDTPWSLDERDLANRVVRAIMAAKVKALRWERRYG